MKWFYRLLVMSVVLGVLPVLGARAQQDLTTIADVSTVAPSAYVMQGVTHIYQGWNNCGPATLTMGLTYFGYPDDQYTAAVWLKPNGEDKNVSPWQMVDYVNTQLDGAVQALVRTGGTIERLKLLVSNDFPVLIEAGYDPEPDRLGWMGHYLLVAGYDDAQQSLITQDSYLGPNKPYAYDYIDGEWRDFNRTYIVLYPFSRQQDMLTLLGTDADPRQNAINTLEAARAEAMANPEDPFAWFNMGSSFVSLGMYAEAAVAFDQSRAVGGGLPWRMLWYQFGPFEAYNAVGRYNDVIALAQNNLNDGGGQYVEETFYYAGVAREKMGEKQRAIDNYNGALSFNPNFTPAREARDRLLAAS